MAGVNSLALLFEDLLTVAVRTRAGRQRFGHQEAFRKQIRSALDTAESKGLEYGYPADDLRLAVFAVAAFLDESILESEYAGHAGLVGEIFRSETFFRNLESLVERPASPTIADLLEIYQLCLLLGFHGRLENFEIGVHLRQLDETIRRARLESTVRPQHVSLPASANAPEFPPVLSVAGDAGAGKSSLIADVAAWGSDTVLLESAGKRVAPATLLVLDCEAFLEPERAEALAQTAHEYRAQLTAGPVYAVFTMADKIKFFADFARNFTVFESREILGSPAGTNFGQAFESVYRSVVEKRARLLAREQDPAARPNIFEFPREFVKLRPPVIEFLTELRCSSLQGFYFTGIALMQSGGAQRLGLRRLFPAASLDRKRPMAAAAAARLAG